MAEPKITKGYLKGVVISSENRLPKRKNAHPGAVDFVPREFDNLLEDQGTRVRITPSVLCPNRTGLNDNNHVLDCQVCFGDEVVDLNDQCQETWASVTGLDLSKRMENNGIFDIKDAKMTFQSGVRVYYWYKVEVLDFDSIYNQIMEKKNSDVDPTRYIPVLTKDMDYYCIGSDGRRYYSNQHFKADTDSHGIRWTTSERPNIGTLFSIVYPILPTFRVLELINDNRYYYIGFKQKEKLPLQLPQQAVVRWDYLAKRSGAAVPTVAAP